jgi:hypothetical protein
VAQTSEFRTRTPERDRRTGERRAGAVRHALEQALGDARREMAGLDRRISDARQRSVAVMDDSGEFGERAAEDEQQIVVFEQEVEAGQRRLVSLQAEVALYGRFLTELDAAG